MSGSEFLGGVLAGACGASVLWLLMDERAGPDRGPVLAAAVTSSEVSSRPDEPADGEPSEGRMGAWRRQLVPQAGKDAGGAGDPGGEALPGEADERVSWDPVEAYWALRRDPVPNAYPWMHAARGLEEVGRKDLGAEAWWTVLRLEPSQAEALAALEVLEPGGVVARMEVELQRHRYFPERAAMEAYLVPRWIESGRLPAAEACVDLDGMLKVLTRKNSWRTLARPHEVHRLHLLMAVRPYEAVLAIEGLLARGQLLSHDERNTLEALLMDTQGVAALEQEPATADSWTAEEREELLGDEYVDAESLDSLLRAMPESLERVEGLAYALLADSDRDPEDRASDLTEFARLFAARGDRDRAFELIDAAVELGPARDAWKLRRQLELGRRPRNL